ncbi:DUF4136 domain-containing protein [Pseudoxanthomonas sp. 10H]|uniref:DUF4136 domain-containing protein n=1 Tax=Pseudoxanthomonas sp. 10H TaxID=3242729 RepID=UPI00355670E7
MSTSRFRIARVLATPLLLCGLLAAAGCSYSPAAARSTPAPGHVTVLMPASVMPGSRYAFVPVPATTAPEQDARVQDAQFRARLQQALDGALQAKGFRPAPMGEADFLVAWRVGVRDLREIQATEIEPPGTTRMAGVKCTGDGCSQLVMRSEDGAPVVRFSGRERTEGGLLVEVVEPRSIRVIWRALNTGTVVPGGGQQERLDAVATQTLAQLPAPR